MAMQVMSSYRSVATTTAILVNLSSVTPTNANRCHGNVTVNWIALMAPTKKIAQSQQLATINISSKSP